MGEFDYIIEEYANLRKRGVAPKESLRLLRPKIELLPKHMKERLAGVVRAYEAGGKENTGIERAESLIAKTTVNRVVKPLPRIEPRDGDTFAMPPPPPKQKSGELPGDVQGSTRRLADDAMPRDDAFGPTSVLLLRIHPSGAILELRPQFAEREMIIGRSDPKSAVYPDVDLAPYNAGNLGVSRRHSAVRFDREKNQLQMIDNSSANGLFINGQKLAMKEVRVLRHGDQLQLGELMVDVAFRHDNLT